MGSIPGRQPIRLLLLISIFEITANTSVKPLILMSKGYLGCKMGLVLDNQLVFLLCISQPVWRRSHKP